MYIKFVSRILHE